MSISDEHLEALMAGSQLQYIKRLMPQDPYIPGVQKMLPPPKPGPKFRVITDQGAEFIIEASEFDLNFNYASTLGSRLRLSGKILSPTNLPGFAHPETERHITIPDEPS